MSFRDRVAYDAEAGTYHDGTMRYMFIKPEALMGIALAMPAAQRPAVIDAMAESVRVAGGKSAATYQSAGADEAEKLLAVIRETSGQLGWGKWDIVLESDKLTVTVEGSPFAAGFGASDFPVCGPIRGMLTAVSSMIFGGPVRVTETACASMGAERCVFEAVPE
ncbi:V4R domain-containing protein [Psychromarinibacter halotolerans]|uniref:V4R domain-containing protein n=1 Tax=Psychromarinibacter halotolerans TaxID=1775175 RepID=A0ABV7GL30_9RHOB